MTTALQFLVCLLPWFLVSRVNLHVLTTWNYEPAYYVLYRIKRVAPVEPTFSMMESSSHVVVVKPPFDLDQAADYQDSYYTGDGRYNGGRGRRRNSNITRPSVHPSHRPFWSQGHDWGYGQNFPHTEGQRGYNRTQSLSHHHDLITDYPPESSDQYDTRNDDYNNNQNDDGNNGFYQDYRSGYDDGYD